MRAGKPCRVRTAHHSRLAVAFVCVACMARSALPDVGVFRRWAAGKKRALVVGIEQYADPKIPPARFADRDAAALAATLRTKLKLPYDDVVLLTNAQATRSPIVRALERLSDECGPNDTLLVFFACHGIPRKDEVYLAPNDMTTFLTEKGISIQDVVRRYLEKSAAGQKILLLDACYSGVAVDVDEQGRVKWGRGQQRGFAGVTQQLVERDAALGIITAASNDQASWGDPKSQHGFFTKHLLAAFTGLADKPPFGNYDGYITADEAYAYVCDRVRDEVKREHAAEQRPMRLFRGAQLLLAKVEPGRFKLDLRSDPPDADVLIDHQPQGKTPYDAQCRNGREYRVTVAKKGFGDWDYRLLWHKEEPVRLLARLHPEGSSDTRLQIALDYLRRGRRELAAPMLRDVAGSESGDALAAFAALFGDALKRDDLAAAHKLADELRRRFPQSAQASDADRAVYERSIAGTGQPTTVEGMRTRVAALRRFRELNPDSSFVPEAEREESGLREQQTGGYNESTARLGKVARDLVEVRDFTAARAAVKRIEGLHSDAKRLDGLAPDGAVLARLGKEIHDAEQRWRDGRAFRAAQAAAIQAERKHEYAAAVAAYDALLRTDPNNRHAEQARGEAARLRDAKKAFDTAQYDAAMEKARGAAGRQDLDAVAEQCEAALRYKPNDPEALWLLETAKPFLWVTAVRSAHFSAHPNEQHEKMRTKVRTTNDDLHTDVYIDGQKVGATPCRCDRVERGRKCRIEVRLKGMYAPAQEVEVAKFGKIPVRFELEERRGPTIPPGFEKAFMLPDSDKDQHGNPVVTRGHDALSGDAMRKRPKGERIVSPEARYDPVTGWPYEVWLNIRVKRGWWLKMAVGLTMEFVLIPAGEFMMGGGGWHEGPVHKVRITRPFYIGKYEVTQAAYVGVVGKKPSLFKGRSNPVECVSWRNCVAFCNDVSESAGVQVTLPTEAEWEYACRAGTQTRFSYGDDPDCSQLGEYAWYGDKLFNKTHQVGQKKPNPWGLHDMHGNVLEWCQDGMRSYTPSAQTDPRGPQGGSRVLRGGSWNYDPRRVRSAYRSVYAPTYAWGDIGFRVVVVFGSPR